MRHLYGCNQHRRCRLWKSKAVLLLLASVLTGCASVKPGLQCNLGPVAKEQQQPVKGPALVPEIQGSMRPMPLDAVDLTDKDITRRVIVQSTYGERLRTDLLAASARFANCTDYNLALEGRTHFMDAQDEQTGPTTAWRPFFVPARSVETYKALSTSPRAQKYLIEVREER